VFGALVFGLGCAEYIAAPTEPTRDVRAIRLSTAAVTLDEGDSLQVLATVLDQLGQPFDAIPAGVTVQWSSSDDAIASVDASGMITGHAAGAAVVAAVATGRFGNVSVSAPVTVRPQVTGFEIVSGDGQTGTVGDALAARFRVRILNRLGAGVPGVAVGFAVTQGGGSLDAASANTDASGIAEAGLTLGTLVGPNVVEARTSRLPLVVLQFTALSQPGPVASLTAISGGGQTGAAGALLPQPLVAAAADRFANPVPGVTVDWAATLGGGGVAPAATTTNASGQASAQWTLGPLDGTQHATASVGGVLLAGFTATAIAPVATVTVAPPAPSVVEGDTLRLTATPRDALGNELFGRPVAWTSDNTPVATVVAGLVTAVSPGSAVITATIGGANGTTTVTVTPAPVASVTVAPATATLGVGGTQPFSATARDAAGRILSGRPVTWSLSDSSLAAIDAGGTLTAIAAGTLTVTATVSGVSGAASVTIAAAPAPVATVEVSPATPTVASGATVQLTATPKDAAGNVLLGRAVTWSSSAPGVAAVDDAGLVLGALAGSATITATVEGVNGTATITVTPGSVAPATSVVSVSAATVPVAGIATITLTARDAAGNALTTGGLVVVFSASGGTSVGTIGPTTDNANGTYAATFTGVTAGSPLTIGATIGGTPVGTTLPTIQVTPPVSGSALLHWTAPQDGNWDDPANWDQGRVPTAQDTAVVDRAGVYRVTLPFTGDVPVGALRIGSPAGDSMTVGVSGSRLVVGVQISVGPGATLELVQGAVQVPELLNGGRLVLRQATVTSANLVNDGVILVRPVTASTESTIDGGLLSTATGLVSVMGVNESAVGLRVVGTLVNRGAMELTSDRDVSDAAVLVTGDFQNRGTLTVSLGAGGLRRIEAAAFTNGGTLVAALNASSPLTIQTTVGGVTNAPGSPGGGVITLTGGVMQVQLPPGASFANVESDGAASVFVGDSTVFSVVGGPFVNAGLLTGRGTVQVAAGLTNDGTIDPGAPGRGPLLILGNVTLSGTSILRLGIGGTNPVTEYDALFANGAVGLGGSLVVELVNGFVPAAGDQFDLVTRLSGAGDFSTVSLPALTGGSTWQLDYTAVGVSITATPPTGVAAAIEVFAGDNQTVPAGAVLPLAPAVRVTDALGNAVPGVAVHFAVTSGGGSVTGADQITNSDGVAAVGSWQVGATAGPNALTATAAGSGITGNPVTFSAIGMAASPLPVRLNAGVDFTCRTSPAPTQCWGANATGKLGDGTTQQRSLPVTVSGGLVFVAVTTGETHACGLTANGAAYCWGDNTHGEFGDGTTTSSATPVPAGGGMLFNQLTAGSFYTCGLDAIGRAYCWGNNGRGNLGDGTTSPRLSPVAVSGGLTFGAISAGGDNHTCALTPGGEAYCWGYNFDGELGDGTFTDRLTPTLVTGSHTFLAISAAPFHTCALDDAGAAWCWGDNNVRQLGDGTPVDQPNPSPVVGGLVFEQISAGGGQTCGLMNTGDAYCWGFNPDGQVGDGTTSIALTPQPVSGGHLFDEIDGGANHTCARTSLGAVWCWGRGSSGQMGQGGLSGSLVPVEVGVLPPSQLGFVTQPGSVLAGAALAPAPRVAIQDATGATVTSATTPVTIAIGTNAGGATLSGTTTIVPVNGVATFNGLSLDQPGTGYTLTATAGTLTPATSATFNVAVPGMLLDIADSDIVGVGLSATVDLTLAAPAPAGGVTVTLTSDSPSLVSVAPPGTAFVPAGTTTGTFTINGLSIGSTTLRASASGYAQATLAVQATNQIISLPATLNVPYGLTASLPVQLVTPAPPGGLAVTLSSSDPSRVGIVTSTVNVAAGATLSSGTLSGVLPGPATITASAPGWVSDQTLATTTATLNVIETSVTINASFGEIFTIELRSGGLPVTAPAPGVTVTLTATNPGCAAFASQVTVPTGIQSVTTSVTNGGGQPLPCTTYIRTTAPNMVPDSMLVTVNVTPSINYGGGTLVVGSGLQTNTGANLGANNYGAVTVRITSTNPTLALVAPNATTPGAAFLDIPLTEPTTSFGFYVQGVEGQTGSTTFTIDAPGFVSTSVPITVRGVGVSTLSLPTATTTLSPNTAFQVYIGVLNAAGTDLQGEQVIRAGGSALTATVTNSNATAAQLVTQALTGQSVTVGIAIGASRSPSTLATGGVQFDPLAAGSTTVQAGIAGVFSAPGATRVVTITAPTINYGGGTLAVGSGLQTSTGANLGANDYGTVTVRITSTNPALALVAPNATTPGTAFIDIPLTEPTTSFSFYVQGVEGQTGSTTFTITAPGFVGTSVPITVRGVGVSTLSLPTATTTLSPNTAFQVYIGVLNAAGTDLQGEQVIRAGGTALTATITNSNATAAQLVTQALTGQSVTVGIAVGQSRSPNALATGGVQFDPLASDTTTVRATIPGTVAAPGATRVVTITAPTITYGGGTLAVGSGLQTSSGANLGANDYGTVTVRITSNNAGLALVAPNATTPGTAFIDIPLTEPTTSFSFYVQGVEGQTGSTTFTITAPGFVGTSVPITVRGVGVSLLSLPTSTAASAANTAFQVYIGVLNAAGTDLQGEQVIRAGGTALTATITNSNATAAQLVTQALTGQSVTVGIAVGQSRSPNALATGGVQFDPLAAGSTTVQAGITGVFSAPGATRIVNVTP
jgi:alpha-tubulin suppressor-like RCC1 family protein/uncharacterized protein YjdB